MYNHRKQQLKLFQDTTLVEQWPVHKTFSWYKGALQANIALHRILYIVEENDPDKDGFRPARLPRIQQHLRKQGFLAI